MRKGEGETGTGTGSQEGRRDGRAYLPSRTRGLVVWVLLLHRGVYFPYREATLGTAQDRTSQDDGEGMLGSAVGIWEAGEGIRAIGVWFVGPNNYVGLGIITGLCHGAFVGHVESRRRVASVGGVAAILDLLQPVKRRGGVSTADERGTKEREMGEDVFPRTLTLVPASSLGLIGC